MAAVPDKEKALELALAQIDKQYGKGSIMRLGERPVMQMRVIPTGSIALDIALGIGGLPRGRIVEIYGPEAGGKCLPADTYLWTDRGLETVAELFARCGQPASCTSRITDVSGLGVRMVNEGGELEPAAALTHNNRKPVSKLTLRSGRTITATENHPLRVMTERGFIAWRTVGEIQQGDYLVSARFGAVEAAAGDGLSEDEAVLLGYLVAEGSLSSRTAVRFTNWDPEVSSEYSRIVEQLFGVEVRNYDDKEFAVHSVALRERLATEYGLDYVTAHGKTVPYQVRTAGHKAQRAFLSALFEGDGWIDASSTIGLGTASEQLAREVQLLLYGLGIPATVAPKWNEDYQRYYWSVTINPAVVHRFLDDVGFRSARRRAQVERYFRRSRFGARFENIPHLAGLIRELRDDCGGDREFDRIAGDLFRSDMNLACSWARLAKIVEWGEKRLAALPVSARCILMHLRSLAERDYTYEEVMAVEDAGKQPTFDVVLPQTHSFLANGVLSHNTTLALHAVASAQRDGGIAAFIDAEHALDPEYAKAIGVDTDALLVSQPDTGEQALEIADMLIRSGALDVIVIDSVAALVPRAEIEGEMGDSHVGLQARLMSQALRKLTGALNNSGTTAIFINQLREKVGVMFGCMAYSTRVTLADGTQEKIGRIVNQRMPVEVQSYNPETDRIEPRRVVNWFDNGNADQFLQFTVAKSGGNGRAQFAATANHLIRTPGGWREAGELVAGDRVMLAEPLRLSDQQWQVILGSVMGDGNISPNRRGRSGVRFRLGHGASQAPYLDWKVSLLGNVDHRISSNGRGAVFADFGPLPELDELRRAVYLGDRRKHLSWDYLKALTPLALAVWYMDEGCSTVRSKGVQERTRGGTGRIDICVETMSPGSRKRLVQYLRDTYDLDARLTRRGRLQQAVLQFTTAATTKFQEIVAPYVPSAMEYKLLPRFRGRCTVEPQFVAAELFPVPAQVLDIHVKPKTRSMRRFDIEVEGNHSYFVDGVMVHNSPETTSGGRALKFYSSIRLDVRRIEGLKDGTDVVGNRTRVKVVKNKCLAEGTVVFDPTTGQAHRMEEIVDGRLPVHVVAATKDGRLRTRPVVGWFDQGEQDVIGVRLLGGTTLWATPDHKLLTGQGWKQAGELVKGDRVAQPREFLGFGDREPYTPDEARMLGYLIGDGHAGGETNQLLALCRKAGIHGKLAWEKTIPSEMFDETVSREVVSNLIFGLLESDGWVSAEPTGAIRIGYKTTSEQLAHQLHWLLLRFGIVSSVRSYDPTDQRPSIVKGRRVQSKRQAYEVRVAGSDNVEAFADAIPTWGPRGQKLRAALASRTGRRRGSQAVYLPASMTAPVLEHLAKRDVSPTSAAQLIGPTAGNPRGGMKQVLGLYQIRRDRLQLLADALDDPFLWELLSEQVRYAAVAEILPAQRRRTFDIEVDELHTFVADDVIVHNCSAPFKQAEMDIIYGKGISREGSLIDVGVEQGIVRKSGAWYTYDGDQLGQGKENVRAFLKDNPDVAAEVEKRILEKLGVGQPTDETGGQQLPPVDF